MSEAKSSATSATSGTTCAAWGSETGGRQRMTTSFARHAERRRMPMTVSLSLRVRGRV